MNVAQTFKNNKKKPNAYSLTKKKTDDDDDKSRSPTRDRHQTELYPVNHSHVAILGLTEMG